MKTKDENLIEDRPDEKKVNRREFLKLVWAGLGGLAAAQMGLISLKYTQPKLGEGEFGGEITAGAVDDFPPGSVTNIREGRFYLTRLADGGFLALYQRCTHLGCTVPYDITQGKFVCPCHNSAFSMEGEVLNTPAPRALDLFALRIEDGQVIVDTGHLITRDHFDISQVVKAS